MMSRASGACDGWQRSLPAHESQSRPAGVARTARTVRSGVSIRIYSIPLYGTLCRRRDHTDRALVEPDALANELREEGQIRPRRCRARHAVKYQPVQCREVVARHLGKEVVLEMEVLVPKEEADHRTGVDGAAREEWIARV